MTGITRPNVDITDFSRQFIDNRLSGSKRRSFEALRHEFHQRLNEYDTRNGNPETITASSAAVESLKDAFINLYLSANLDTVHGKYIVELRDNDLSYCPYCFSITRPTTLDHYLPKSKFPEFSVFPLNLVPMCSKCQTIKDEKFLDQSKRKIFIHPYYDAIANVRILEIEITPPYDVPTSVSVVPHSSLNGQWNNLVSRHIENIKINSRYGKNFSVEYTRLRRNAAYARRMGRNVKDTIDQFHFDAQAVSVNSWSSILYEHALINRDLLDYLCKGPVPENL